MEMDVFVRTYSQYDPPPTVMEECPDENLVDRDSYVRTEDQIERFIEAGERLNLERSFFYKDEDSVNEEDMGSEELNFIDALQASKEVKKRMEKFKKKNEDMVKKEEEDVGGKVLEGSVEK